MAGVGDRDLRHGRTYDVFGDAAPCDGVIPLVRSIDEAIVSPVASPQTTLEPCGVDAPHAGLQHDGAGPVLSPVGGDDPEDEPKDLRKRTGADDPHGDSSCCRFGVAGVDQLDVAWHALGELGRRLCGESEFAELDDALKQPSAAHGRVRDLFPLPLIGSDLVTSRVEGVDAVLSDATAYLDAVVDGLNWLYGVRATDIRGAAPYGCSTRLALHHSQGGHTVARSVV